MVFLVVVSVSRARNTKVYKICKILQAFVFCILQHFATKLFNFTNFRMLFNAVAMNFTISIFFKTLSMMQSVHSDCGKLTSNVSMIILYESEQMIRNSMHIGYQIEDQHIQ